MRVLTTALALLLAPSAILAQGHTVRPTGWDLDRDGVLDSSPAICDDVSGATVPVAEDLWAGGTGDENQFYVDCDSGSNGVSCGSPDSPCATVSYAIANRISGGDVICVTGTCAEGNFDLPAGALTTTAIGGRDTEYPTDPTVLAPWDTDGDDDYSDETAVFNMTGLAFGFAMDGGGFHIAHLTFNDIADGCPGAGGFLDNAEPGEDTTTGVWIHDVTANGILEDCADDSARIAVLEGFGAWAHVNIENSAFLDIGSYMTMRGSGGPGPLRFYRSTFRAKGANGANGVFLAKPWGGWDAEPLAIAWDENVFDCNGSAWGEECGGINVAQCSQNIRISGNHFIDFVSIGHIQAFDSGASCAAPVDDVLVDSNLFESSNGVAAACVTISDETGGTGSYGWLDITITNNTCRFTGSSAYENGFAIFSGSLQANSIATVVGNTLYGDSQAGLLRASLLVNEDGPEVRWLNNIVDGQTNHPVIAAPSGVTDWTSDGNVYPVGSDYDWDGTLHATLAAFRTASGDDTNSQECSPTYVSESTDLHLAEGDTCARGTGVDVSTYTTTDRDGDARSLDAGSDQYLAAAMEAVRLFLR